MSNCIRDAAPDAWGTASSSVAGSERAARILMRRRLMNLPTCSNLARTFVSREASAASLEELQATTDLVGRDATDAGPGSRAHTWKLDRRRPAQGDDYLKQHEVHRQVLLTKRPLQGGKGRVRNHATAHRSGACAALVSLERAAGKDVLLIERFDRQKANGAWERHAMVSALLLLRFDEMMARYASYEDLATLIRHRFTSRRSLYASCTAGWCSPSFGATQPIMPATTRRSGTEKLMLTPAYDICPQTRTRRNNAGDAYCWLSPHESDNRLR